MFLEPLSKYTGYGEEWVRKFANNEYPAKRILQGEHRSQLDWTPKSFEFYVQYNPHYHRHLDNAYTIRTTYGCFWNCIFCLNKCKQVLYKDFNNISNQLQFLAQKGIKSIRVIDEIFTFHPRFADITHMICDLGFEWTAQDRISNLTAEKVAFLKDNNCSLIQTGIESLCNEILIKLKKKVTVKEIEDKVKICTDYNLKELACLHASRKEGDVSRGGNK